MPRADVPTDRAPGWPAASEMTTALGTMSGTSRDGVDVAFVRTDGERWVETGPFASFPYDAGFRNRLAEAISGAADMAAVERELTVRHAEAVNRFLLETGIAGEAVGVIGFHGHTVLHDPGHRRTRQIGDGAALAMLTGRHVVCDFRSADVAAGGEGAPFAPLYHRARAAGLERPMAVLNLGGVANVTWLGAEEEVIAFDTGPGNALIDDIVRRRAGLWYDRDGALAAAGRADPSVLEALLDHRYFERPPPKSLDRDEFGVSTVDALEIEDAAATLTAFTAASVERALDHLPAPPRRWLACGGGRRNAALMAALRERLPGPVDPVEVVGWNGDAIEAEAFAYLAVRAMKGLPLSLPSTTGVPAPMPGGRLVSPRP